MSAAIGSELHHFLNCLWYGIVLFLVYDGLRIFRTILRHAGWLIGLEDIIFWIWAAFYLFSHFFIDTYGAVRGYQLLGVGIGGTIWEYGCGRFLTKKLIFFIRWLKFRVRRCKILVGMRSLMSQKKQKFQENKLRKKQLLESKLLEKKRRKHEKGQVNAESVTGGKTAGEKNAGKKSRKKSETKSGKKPQQKSRRKSEKESGKNS